MDAVLKPSSLVSLPRDILISLSKYLHNIEDLINLSSASKELRVCMKSALPNTILHLAAAQSKIFFRPSPHFLVAATARELGAWARRSEENERILADEIGRGIEGLMDLALDHCGLTLERIRELYLMRFLIINPVINIIDQCVGEQWHAVDNFWSGGRSDAYTLSADPPLTFFHLAIYGELFGPDFEPILNEDNSSRRLSVETRLEYIKYILPDYAVYQQGDPTPRDCWTEDGLLDPRRAIKDTGPYAHEQGQEVSLPYNHNIALKWVQKSSRWKPHWTAARAKAGGDFDEFPPDSDEYWRQEMLEHVCYCQGLEGLGMIRPECQDQWIDKIKSWRDRILRLRQKPKLTKVGIQETLEFPYLRGDLNICASGYVLGT